MDTECKNAPSVNSRGYGTVRVNKIMKLRHRVAWEEANGPIPEGLYVCHHCDNKACYEVTHLFLGTQQDNVDDYNRKELRDVSGERNGASKLTEDDVYEIRKLYNTGKYTQICLAKQFGVRQNHLSRIVRGKCWARL